MITAHLKLRLCIMVNAGSIVLIATTGIWKFMTTLHIITVLMFHAPIMLKKISDGIVIKKVVRTIIHIRWFANMRKNA